MNAPAKGIGLTTLIALIRKEIGDAGEIGPQGPEGPQGPQGPQGAQGPKGNTGPAGKQGPKGNDGKQGKPGKDGKDGEDGVGIEDIHQDGDDMMVITMTDGEIYEIELPKGENTEVQYNKSGGGGGSVDLKKYVEKPTTDEGWMVYKLGEGWALATTDLIETNPAVTFRDDKGRFKSTKQYEDLTTQLKVNRFLALEIEEQAETLAKEAEMRRTKDDFLQEQINNISEKGYDDTGIRDDLAQEIADREQGDKDLEDKILVEANTRRKADEGLQSEINTLADTVAEESKKREEGDSGLQDQIDAIQEKGYDDTEIRTLIDDEILNRTLADIGVRDGLQKQIDILQQWSFSELDEKIDKESNTRREADKGLQAEINSLAITLAEESKIRGEADEALDAKIDGIEIPSLDGYATEDWVTGEIDKIEFPETDLSEYAKTEYVDGAVSSEADTRRVADEGLQGEINTLADTVANLDIPSIDGLATEEWVTGEINAIEFPETDLSEYAKTEYVDDAVNSEAETRRVADEGLQKEIDTLADNLASLEIPSIDGLATEEWVTNEIGKIEFPETDLSEYAKTEYVDAGDSALQDQIDALQPYDDSGIKQELADEAEARESADKELDDKIERERIDRSMADIGLRDSLKAEIDAIEFPETDLSDYYTKEEVNDSQAAQDELISDNASAIEKNRSDLDFLQTEINANTEAITKNKNDLAFLQTEVDKNTAGVAKNKGDIQILEGGINDNAAAIEEEAKIRAEADEALDAKIDAIEFPETDLSDYYTKGEVDESQGIQDDKIGGLRADLNQETIDRIKGDNQLQAEIEEIALILSTLAKSIESGYWSYVGNGAPSQQGEFSLAFPDVTSEQNIVTFNEKDIDGKTHLLPNTVSVGDYLEIVDQEHPEEFGLWQVAKEPDGTGVFSIEVNLVQAGGTFDIGDKCEVRFFSVSDELDMNDLDARYLKLTGGEVTGAVSTTRTSFSATDFVNRNYVSGLINDRAQNYVKKTGAQEMEGPLSIDGKLNLSDTLVFGRDHSVLARINPAGGTTQEVDLFEGNSGGQILRFDLQGATYKNAIEFQSGSSNNKNVILRLDANNGIRIHGLNADNTKIKDVADPTENKDAANKQYVDNTVKAEVDGNFVSKTGGDEMQGPFKITNNPDLSSRDGRKIEVLDIKSGSDNSSLNLGAKNTTIYVGANQTTFIKPVLLQELGGKDDRPIKLLNEGTEDEHLVSKGYVDGAVQSGIEGIELPEPDLSNYVSTVDGDQSMKGPLEIHSLGAWAASRIKLQYVTSRSETEILQLGTPAAEDMLKVSKDYVNVKGPYPLRVREIQGSNGSGGTTYTGAYTDDDHIATKKDVQAAVEGIGGGGDVDLSGYMPLAGDSTKTGLLTVSKSSNVAFQVKQNSTIQTKIWSSGAIEVPNYTAFKAKELVTKEYVDNKVSSGGGGGGFTPGDQVAKTDGSTDQVGGFWIESGSLYVRVQ